MSLSIIHSVFSVSKLTWFIRYIFIIKTKVLLPHAIQYSVFLFSIQYSCFQILLIIWLFNILALKVPDEGGSRNVSLYNGENNKGNNKITELRTIFQRESQNS